MIANLHFFAYDDSTRQTFHRLIADTKVDSLSGFMYGEKIRLTEHLEGSISRNYVVADRPIKQKICGFFNELTFDIYLALEDQWPDFKPHLDYAINRWHGPSL